MSQTGTADHHCPQRADFRMDPELTHLVLPLSRPRRRLAEPPDCQYSRQAESGWADPTCCQQPDRYHSENNDRRRDHTIHGGEPTALRLTPRQR
jgi:hypothetical protein